MKRTLFAVIAGAVVWVVVVSLLDRLLRLGIPGYTAAEPTFAFTLIMMLARLGIGALSSLAAGAVAAAVARSPARAPWITGVIFLVLFVPEHIKIGNALPLWYHLSFLLTLVPLFWAGGLLARRPAAAPAAGISAGG
ncbi:hypothetical protein [Nevskia soli]|uniref:hypothetical protein n=1 Tax=Nevskia soli TaxID=418856 RepID=UPI0004A6DBF7|nr:hypothetical protein [Nevskia soli]